MVNKRSPTLSQAVEQVLAQVDGPIAVEEFARRVLAIHLSKAKNPLASLRNHLRWNQVGRTLVFLDSQTILPLRIAMRGVRFRIPLSSQEAGRGVLFIYPAFQYFLRWMLDPAKVQLLDQSGDPLPVRVVRIQEQVRTVFGEYTEEYLAFDLGDWFRANRIRRNDSILVTIEDWEAGCFRLEHEPAEHRRDHEIAQKDQELADLLFNMLEAARSESLLPQDVVTAYARLANPRGYPGSHWLEVVARDPRVKYDGFAIRYSDFQSLLEAALFEPGVLSEEAFSPAQGRQVYRLKAALWDRPDLWRTIEVQGKQTLADLDAILRDAFRHDPGDHLGGFWKLVRRGNTKRFRQVDLGSVDPLGGGDAAERHIAGLGLQPGDELKYVYDFGDWIEHRITLEAITEPEKGAQYPRIIARNQPRYRYCQSCQAQGRKIRATWICIECSGRQQRQVLVCKRCLDREHEDHFAEEILY